MRLSDHGNYWPPGRYRESRLTGHLASLWARRLANHLSVEGADRCAIVHAARYVTVRNYRGALHTSALPLVQRYRSGQIDLAVGIIRVAESFALATVRPGTLPRPALALMESDVHYYPVSVVDALKTCLGVRLPPVAGNVA